MIAAFILSQELLALLSHLDRDKVGYVSLDEFVRGLQFIRNAAVITSTPPPTKTASLRRAHSEIIVCIVIAFNSNLQYRMYPLELPLLVLISLIVATTIFWHSHYLSCTSTFPFVNSSTSKCYIHHRYQN